MRKSLTFSVSMSLIASCCIGVGTYTWKWKSEKDDFDNLVNRWHVEHVTQNEELYRRLDRLDGQLDNLNNFLLSRRVASGETP